MCRLLFSLCCQTTYYETTDARNMELNQNANEKFSEDMAHKLNLKYRTRQVSSCLASPAVISFQRIAPMDCSWAAAFGQLPAQAAAAGCGSDPQLLPLATVGP